MPLRPTASSSAVSSAAREVLRTCRLLALGFGLALVPALLPPSPAQAATPAGAGPVVEVDDVYRFYRIYDAAGGRPSAETLQRDYLDAGSPGLKVFAERRRITGERIAEAIARDPAQYVEAKRCMEALPAVRTRLEEALAALGRLYPQARYPAVTIAVGRGKPVGIGYPDTGVQIGLEALCATRYLNPDLEDRFVHVIAHEFVHVQQQVPDDEDDTTVLQSSLLEGVAEFVTERISGQVAYSHLAQIVAGREAQIEADFARDIDKTDLSDWLYNATADTPGDLGYWVGYRIAKAYYLNAQDKPQAIRDMFAITDPKAFLAASGWTPGMQFPDP